jgi:hypothetical protein
MPCFALYSCLQKRPLHNILLRDENERKKMKNEINAMKNVGRAMLAIFLQQLLSD